MVSEATIVDDRFRKLSKKDKTIMQSQVSKILKHLDISHNDNRDLLQNDNAFSLVE